MTGVLQREAAAGFPRLSGARVSAAVPVPAAVLNEWLRRIPGVPPGLTVEVQPANRLVLRYGLLHVAAVLDAEARLDQGRPIIWLTMASSVVAWTLRQVWQGRAVRTDGRRIGVDLAALDAAGRLGPYWACLERLRLETSAGQVHIQCGVAVR